MKDKATIVTVPGRKGRIYNLPFTPGAKWFARRMPDADEANDYYGETKLHQTAAEAFAVVDGWAPVEVIEITEDMKT